MTEPPSGRIRALGLVFYELFAGRMLFPVRTLEERVYASQTAPLVRASLPGIDPVVERIIDSCLEKDPAERPMSALAVAALLPGGDPLTAALAEGRVPSPDMIAAAGRKGALAPALAWALLAPRGTLAVASQAHVSRSRRRRSQAARGAGRAREEHSGHSGSGGHSR